MANLNVRQTPQFPLFVEQCFITIHIILNEQKNMACFSVRVGHQREPKRKLSPDLFMVKAMDFDYTTDVHNVDLLILLKIFVLCLFGQDVFKNLYSTVSIL